MLKILQILFLSVIVTSVHAFDTSVNDRVSLQKIFEKSFNELNNSLTDYDFSIYSRSFEYALDNLDEMNLVEWGSTGSTLSGKITIVSKTQEGNRICKSFIHSLRMGDKIFEGEGLGCKINGQWVIKK